MITAILLSGGVGQLMNDPTPKQYLPLGDSSSAQISYTQLHSHPRIDEIVVVCEPYYYDLFPGALFASPGLRRQDSLFNGLQKCSETTKYILTHEATRPFLTEEDIDAIIEAGITYGAAALATPVKETLKQANSALFVTATLNSKALYQIQTPQVLHKEILVAGFEKAYQDNLTVTTDVTLAELIDQPVKLVIGSTNNIKITTPQDLNYAQLQAAHLL